MSDSPGRALILSCRALARQGPGHWHSRAGQQEEATHRDYIATWYYRLVILFFKISVLLVLLIMCHGLFHEAGSLSSSCGRALRVPGAARAREFMPVIATHRRP